MIPINLYLVSYLCLRVCFNVIDNLIVLFLEMSELSPVINLNGLNLTRNDLESKIKQFQNLIISSLLAENNQLKNIPENIESYTTYLFQVRIQNLINFLKNNFIYFSFHLHSINCLVWLTLKNLSIWKFLMLQVIS